MDYVDPYLDDGVDLGEIDIDSLDADVSPEQIMCMMEELKCTQNYLKRFWQLEKSTQIIPQI